MKIFNYYIEPQVIMWFIGAIILWFTIPFKTIIGVILIAWGVIYWYNSGKYSR